MWFGYCLSTLACRPHGRRVVDYRYRSVSSAPWTESAHSNCSKIYYVFVVDGVQNMTPQNVPL